MDPLPEVPEALEQALPLIYDPGMVEVPMGILHMRWYGGHRMLIIPVGMRGVFAFAGRFDLVLNQYVEITCPTPFLTQRLAERAAQQLAVTLNENPPPLTPARRVRLS